MSATTARIGFWAAIAAALAIAGYGVAQLLQLAGLIGYPTDEIAIYATSICIAPPFLMTMLALAEEAATARRVWSRASVMFAGFYVVFALLVYAVQLGTVIPYSGGVRSSSILAVTPHSLFWTVDALAYLSMGAACGLAGLSLSAEREAIWPRRWLLAHAAVSPLVATAYFYPRFSVVVLMLGAPWLITAPGAMLALARLFHRRHPD